MKALSSVQKMNNIKVGMQLYLEGRFGWEKPIKVDTFADPIGLWHVVKYHVSGSEVIITEKLPETWIEEQETGFEYRPSDETIAQLMLLVG